MYQNNVIRFDPDAWYTMRQLRESVRGMQETDPVKYMLPIKKEQECYKDLLRNTAVAA